MFSQRDRVSSAFAVRAGLLVVALGLSAPASAQTAKPAAPAPAAAAAAAPAAPADSGPPQPDWVKLCSQNPANQQQVCVVTRERRAATGQLLAAVSIREMQDKKILVTAVPPGMLLRPGLQIQIDAQKALKGAYSICFPNLCFAEADITADFIASLKKGTKIIVTTLNQAGKPVNFDIALAGFSAAYDGKAIDPKDLQAEQQKLQDELAKKAEEARKQLIDKQQQQSTAQ